MLFYLSHTSMCYCHKSSISLAQDPLITILDSVPVIIHWFHSKYGVETNENLKSISAHHVGRKACQLSLQNLGEVGPVEYMMGRGRVGFEFTAQRLRPLLSKTEIAKQLTEASLSSWVLHRRPYITFGSQNEVPSRIASLIPLMLRILKCLHPVYLQN